MLVKVNPATKRPSLFNNLFDEFFTPNFPQAVVKNGFASRPSINVIETDEGYRIEVAAPGLSKEDFKVSIEKDLLTISAEKQNSEESKEEKFTRREFNFSSFKRSFHLPETVDAQNINASYENGVLHVGLAKREEAKELPARTIEIS